MATLKKVLFHRFPKIFPPQATSFPTGVAFTVQEKMDGSNMGLQLEEGRLIVHSKTRALAAFTQDGQVEYFVDDLGHFSSMLDYLQSRIERIFGAMTSAGLIHLYGEWMVQHTLEYPEDIWNQVYVFDVITAQGFYRNPEDFADSISLAGLNRVQSVEVEPSTLGTETVVERAQAIAETMGKERRIEGVVVKSYENVPADADKDSRPAMKIVLEDFKEDHKNNKMFPPPKEALTPEDRMAAYLSERTIEKAIQRSIDDNGSWKTQLIPIVMAFVWQDFIQEVMMGALEREKMPVLNTRTLLYIIQGKTRQYILQWVKDGQ